jgi:heme oxygenase
MPLTISILPVAALVKEATQQYHTEVENLLLPKLSSISTADDYAAILKMFYGYFSPLERCIQQHLTAAYLPDVPERRKAAAILDDLQAIGQSTAHIEHCTMLPQIENTAQAFGAMYVLEGSSLGGKVIAKMLLKNEALSVTEDALHFFSGYKEETGSRWKTFLTALNGQTETKEIVASANETFFYLKAWMQHTLYDNH